MDIDEKPGWERALAAAGGGKLRDARLVFHILRFKKIGKGKAQHQPLVTNSL
jgi:hypothetical protein